MRIAPITSVLFVFFLTVTNGYSQTSTDNSPKQSFCSSIQWGVHAGTNYSVSFLTYSPRAGLFANYHPGFLGIQTELNYVRRIQDWSQFLIFSDPDGTFNFYSDYIKVKANNLEMPFLLVLGRQTQKKFQFNFHVGMSLNYAVGGPGTRDLYWTRGTVVYADFTSPFAVTSFPKEEYQRFQFRKVLGFTLGYGRIALGVRADAGSFTRERYFTAEISSYLAYRFR